MATAGWFLLVGLLLLAMGLRLSLLQRLPITSAIIYLVVGIVVGPTVLDLFHFNPLKQSALLETLTECAVLLSLFTAGIKMPVPLVLKRWRTPILLAWLGMALTVALVTGFGVWVLGLPLGAAVLLGGIVAPTDPVLATDVQVRHFGDRDRLRFALTCEAGMNDGSAFPLVVLGLGLLGLHPLGEYGLHWLSLDVLWATAGGVALGALSGWLLARLVWRLRFQRRGELLDEFLGLGLIGMVYGASLLLQVWGFLAVFFAAVALRQTELRLAGCGDRSGADAALVGDATEAESEPQPRHLSEGALIFKEPVERLSEVVLIILIGGTLFIDSWSWPAVGFALFLFLVARPLSVLVSLLGTRTPWRMRGLAAWFGVRGIGSLYYLMFAISQGLPEALALELIRFTLIVVTLSILVHGISVRPAMARFWQRPVTQRQP